MQDTDIKFSSKEVNLAANGTAQLPVGEAELITFYAQTGAFEISVDGGEFVDLPSTKRLEFPAGYLSKRIDVKDTSGNANLIKFYAGNVRVSNTDEVSLSGSVVISSLPSVAIADGQSLSISGTPTVTNTPSTVTTTAAIANITASTAYSSKRWIRVANTGGSATTISIGGNDKTVASGGEIEMPCLGRGESYPEITVDGATSACTVETLNA